MEQTWNLEKLCDEKNFDALLTKLQKQISEIETAPSLKEKIALAQEAQLVLRQASSFAVCLLSADVHHKQARGWEVVLTGIDSDLEKVWIAIDQELLKISVEQIADLGDPAIHFALKERREFAQKKLSADKENLISDLSVDGYHGWGQFFESYAGRLEFPFENKRLSAGQIANKITDGNREVRKQAFKTFTNVYEKHAPIFAQTLNHIAGHRLKVYEHRGWANILDEPMMLNRMSEKTLDAMWSAISAHRAPLIEYLKKRAPLLGVEKPAWYDLDAPLPAADSFIPYDEGAQFIIEQFGKFSPKMAEFAERALKERWVEAEDRPGKRHGGFCIDFPLAKESRIFMTYSGTLDNVSTLAHELGHAFHSEQMFDLPELAQHYRMNVAETASTMAEMIVADSRLEMAKNDEQKLFLLDDKVARDATFLCNIHTRFLFEKRFYAKRADGYVSPDELNALMLEAQKECYGDSLSKYHPTFWASKMHFYLTDVPFYNFPYTFGHLFSRGIYARLKKDPSQFENAYIPLLRDTGMMTTEELANRHLGIDLTAPTFWEETLAAITSGTQDFLDLLDTSQYR